MSRLHVLVMAKAPVAGRVKTRLCPPLSPEAAAGIAAAALADTLAAVGACSADRKVIALDGQPGRWLPRGFDVIPQAGRGLDERLANAWVATGGWGIQIGMDTPQVTAAELDGLLLGLEHGRALLGPALDGGWWVIGLRAVDPRRVFADVEMGTPHTGASQLRRLRGMGLEVSLVHKRRDIDTVTDLAAVAEAHPGLRTARSWRRWLTSSTAAAAS